MEWCQFDRRCPNLEDQTEDGSPGRSGDSDHFGLHAFRQSLVGAEGQYGESPDSNEGFSVVLVQLQVVHMRFRDLQGVIPVGALS